MKVDNTRFDVFTKFYLTNYQVITSAYQAISEIKQVGVDASVGNIAGMHSKMVTLTAKINRIKYNLIKDESITIDHIIPLVVDLNHESSEWCRFEIEDQICSLQERLNDITRLKDLIDEFEQNFQ